MQQNNLSNLSDLSYEIRQICIHEFEGYYKGSKSTTDRNYAPKQRFFIYALDKFKYKRLSNLIQDNPDIASKFTKELEFLKGRIEKYSEWYKGWKEENLMNSEVRNDIELFDYLKCYVDNLLKSDSLEDTSLEDTSLKFNFKEENGFIKDNEVDKNQIYNQFGQIIEIYKKVFREHNRTKIEDGKLNSFIGDLKSVYSCADFSTIYLPYYIFSNWQKNKKEDESWTNNADKFNKIIEKAFNKANKFDSFRFTFTKSKKFLEKEINKENIKIVKYRR